jgi:hypothetical protein
VQSITPAVQKVEVGEFKFKAGLGKGSLISNLKRKKKEAHIILSEVSLAQKTKNCMFSLICGH